MIPAASDLRQRARPSLEDRLESGGLLCGRDALAGGTVLALQVGRRVEKPVVIGDVYWVLQ